MSSEDKIHGRRTAEPAVGPDLVVGIRQVVATNLRLAREARGWSQLQLADRLTIHTNRSWTNVMVSAAESTWDFSRARKRSFDVDDLLAYAVALRVPLAWFFSPPRALPNGTTLESDRVKFSYGKRVDDRPPPTLTQRQLSKLASMVGEGQELWLLKEDWFEKMSDLQGESRVPFDAFDVDELQQLQRLLTDLLDAVRDAGTEL